MAVRIGKRAKRALVEVDELLSERQSVVVQVEEGRSFEASYSLPSLTVEAMLRMERVLKEFDDGELGEGRTVYDQVDDVVGVLLSIGIEWSLARGGEPVPTNDPGLRSVPVRILRSTFFAVLGAASPNPSTSAS
ncbi:MAG: hypothetical protein KIT11_05400 [Fimbriimonadaceae bacterium]|nr:hypothetical protein [Fimbriimonadaceae bacterium]QYK56672.1 MAG: hypothetical protein KF733_04120 [Fimbriimonadaceae bacterium]